jgi:hypothetical protein
MNSSSRSSSLRHDRHDAIANDFLSVSASEPSYQSLAVLSVAAVFTPTTMDQHQCEQHLPQVQLPPFNRRESNPNHGSFCFSTIRDVNGSENTEPFSAGEFD